MSQWLHAACSAVAMEAEAAGPSSKVTGHSETWDEPF